MTTFNLEQPAKELTEALSKAPPLSVVPVTDAVAGSCSAERQYPL
jgi:hypothetical protein